MWNERGHRSMGSVSRTGSHLIDVGAILVLGFVYVCLLSLASLVSAVRDGVTSAWSAGGAVGRRLRSRNRSAR